MGIDPGKMHKHYAKKLGDKVRDNRSHQSMKAHTAKPGSLFNVPTDMNPMDSGTGFPGGMGFNPGKTYAGQ